ncbi:MAG TPA: hypothetical protein PLU71_00870 [Candidatus Dependentiae bacterium]|nr:hypothetical protein [Candidatus Dependentiae bacterium]HRQ62386.1 hypothetical protein [Candidatus Dependentiae bacterium]
MSQFMHCIIGIGLFNLVWHMYLKHLPPMHAYIKDQKHLITKVLAKIFG